MDRAASGLFVAFVVAVLMAAPLAGCGGDGGSKPPPPAAPAPGPTRFRGNLARMTALQLRHSSPSSQLAMRIPLSFADQADAQETGVQVCVEGTAFCSSTDDNGQFVLVAAVSGNIALLFSGTDFSARLMLSGVPMGAVVTIQDIECSTSSGRCTPHRIDVEAPMPTDVPLANQPPDCTLATANPSTLFPPNHQMVAIFIAGITDPDGDEVIITPTNVFQDEPVLGTGSGDTEPDATLNPLTVRAERSGQGNGRVYTVSFVADDRHGASCTGSVQVCVPHDERPEGTCSDDGPAFDSTVR